MIKINLLSTKRKAPRKVTELQQQMVLGVLILVLVGMGIGYYWNMLNARIDELNEEKTAAEARLREQNNQLKAVKTVEAERKVVTDKIQIIEQLKKNQRGPVRLLDELSKALPTGVNLTSLSEKNLSVNISGDAFSNNAIVRYVDNLKVSPFFSGVYLLETRQAKLAGVEIYKYKMNFRFKGK